MTLAAVVVAKNLKSAAVKNHGGHDETTTIFRLYFPRAGLFCRQQTHPRYYFHATCSGSIGCIYRRGSI